MTVTYHAEGSKIPVGTFLFKNSEGSTKNRIWCEFAPRKHEEMLNSDGYKQIKNLNAYDKREHSVFSAL